jgi:hypothetical protein
MAMLLRMAAATAIMSASAFVAAPPTAEAQCRDCPRPGVTTSHSTKTVRPVTRSTRYRDVNNTRYVTHTRRVVNVTRVQPVTRVNVVTRVHRQNRIVNKRENVARTRTLPAQTVTTGRTQVVSQGSGRDRVQTVYRYNTVQRVSNVTRYRDVNRVNYVQRVHRHVTTTEVRPIHRVNVVTRVHNRVVVRNRVENVARTEMLPARTITTARTVNMGCRC